MTALLQFAVAFAVLLLILTMAWQLLGFRRNNIQLEIDIQILDPGTNQFTGELLLTLLNVGRRTQAVRNIFIEVRQSRHENRNGLILVSPVNIISRGVREIRLTPGIREVLTWSFDIPRDIRLLRAVAFMDTGRRYEAETVPTLTQEFFTQFNSGRFATRIFPV
jgi:hypothetical protein